MAVEFEHRGRFYRISEDYVRCAVFMGKSNEDLIAIFRRGLDGIAKISKAEDKKKTKQVAIDKNVHDKLKFVAEWLGMTPYHTLEMIVTQFTDRALASLEASKE